MIEHTRHPSLFLEFWLAFFFFFSYPLLWATPSPISCLFSLTCFHLLNAQMCRHSRRISTLVIHLVVRAKISSSSTIVVKASFFLITSDGTWIIAFLWDESRLRLPYPPSCWLCNNVSRTNAQTLAGKFFKVQCFFTFNCPSHCYCSP